MHLETPQNTTRPLEQKEKPDTRAIAREVLKLHKEIDSWDAERPELKAKYDEARAQATEEELKTLPGGETSKTGRRIRNILGLTALGAATVVTAAVKTSNNHEDPKKKIEVTAPMPAFDSTKLDSSKTMVFPGIQAETIQALPIKHNSEKKEPIKVSLSQGEKIVKSISEDDIEQVMHGLKKNNDVRVKSPEDFELLKLAIIRNEGSNYRSISPKGALGRYQIMPVHLYKIHLDKDNPDDIEKFLSSPEKQYELFEIVLKEFLNKNDSLVGRTCASYLHGSGDILWTEEGDNIRDGVHNNKNKKKNFKGHSVNEYGKKGLAIFLILKQDSPIAQSEETVPKNKG